MRPFVVSMFLAAALMAQSMEEQARPAGDGWRAALVHRSETGVWYARVAKVVDAYGAPEVIVTDDAGRLSVLSVYSGKWTATSVTPDGQWLAPSLPADVDPRVPGREIYAAGLGGNVHRVWLEPRPFAKFELRSVEIGHAAGEEFHTVLAGDLRPTHAGDELLAFAISGAVYALTPGADDGSASFTMAKVATLPGRVRDAVVLPGGDATAPRVVCASRSGHLLQLRWLETGLEHQVLAAEPMGLGRLAHTTRGGDVLYVTRDDGVALRFAAREQGGWDREVVFVGAQGLRGVAAGRFFDDPQRESIAVFGYGRKVQVVSRVPGQPWQVETIHIAGERGHWLVAGELDGRNSTDELIATCFDGAVVLLGRQPGYGLPAAAVDAEPASSAPEKPLSATAATGPASPRGGRHPARGTGTTVRRTPTRKPRS